MKAIEVTKKDFLEKIYNIEVNPQEWKYEGDKPCIVDFFATWCGPCKALSPILDEVAEEFEGRIYVYKVDVDKESELSDIFGIRSVPTLLLCAMTEHPQILQGTTPKDQLKKAINDFLLKK